MNFKLAIDDVVQVPIKLTIKDKLVARLFAFSLTCKRLPQEEITERLEDQAKLVSTFMAEVVTGWDVQRLVLTEDDQPAPFSPEALDALLNIAGVARVLFAAYLKECGAKEKN